MEIEPRKANVMPEQIFYCSYCKDLLTICDHCHKNFTVQEPIVCLKIDHFHPHCCTEVGEKIPQEGN